jgi:hypothetical protein
LIINIAGRRKAVKVGSDLRTANAAAARLRKAIARGEYRLPDPPVVRPTFAELARDWLARYPLTHDLRPSTMENYACFTERQLLPYFGTMRVDTITPRLIEDFIVANRLPGGSARPTCCSRSTRAACPRPAGRSRRTDP